MKQPRLAAPSDLSGRLLHCAARARLFADVLGNDERTLCSDSLLALGEVAGELADELEAIEQAVVERSNRLYALEHPEESSLRDGAVERSRSESGPERPERRR